MSAPVVLAERPAVAAFEVGGAQAWSWMSWRSSARRRWRATARGTSARPPAGAPAPEAVSADLWEQVVWALGQRPHGTRCPQGVGELAGLVVSGGRQAMVLLACARLSRGREHAVTATNRTVAQLAGCSRSWTEKVRADARASGLLIRQTHGAGRARAGARDVLAFPGGALAARAFLAGRRAARHDAHAAAVAAKVRAGDPGRYMSSQACRLLSTHPELTQLLADALGVVDDTHGALGVITVVLDRHKAGRGAPMRNPVGYIRTAVRGDRTHFAALWAACAVATVPPPAPRPEAGGHGALARTVRDVAASLAPPG